MAVVELIDFLLNLGPQTRAFFDKSCHYLPWNSHIPTLFFLLLTNQTSRKVCTYMYNEIYKQYLSSHTLELFSTDSTYFFITRPEIHKSSYYTPWNLLIQTLHKDPTFRTLTIEFKFSIEMAEFELLVIKSIVWPNKSHFNVLSSVLITEQNVAGVCLDLFVTKTTANVDTNQPSTWSLNPGNLQIYSTSPIQNIGFQEQVDN